MFGLYWLSGTLTKYAAASRNKQGLIGETCPVKYASLFQCSVTNDEVLENSFIVNLSFTTGHLLKEMDIIIQCRGLIGVALLSLSVVGR